MKVYFTADELHTAEYKEYVKWVGECWRLNNDRNKRIEEEKRLSSKIRQRYLEDV
jgi:hypothetical protein